MAVWKKVITFALGNNKEQQRSILSATLIILNDMASEKLISIEKQIEVNRVDIWSCYLKQMELTKEYINEVFEDTKCNIILFDYPQYAITYYFGDPQDVKILGVTRDFHLICQEGDTDDTQDNVELSLHEFNNNGITDIYCSVCEWYEDYKRKVEKESASK